MYSKNLMKKLMLWEEVFFFSLSIERTIVKGWIENLHTMYYIQRRAFYWISLILGGILFVNAVRIENGIDCPAKCMCFPKNIRCMMQKLNWVPRVPKDTTVLWVNEEIFIYSYKYFSSDTWVGFESSGTKEKNAGCLKIDYSNNVTRSLEIQIFMRYALTRYFFLNNYRLSVV